ncbi:cobalamin-binding protein [Cognatiyoonia sp. IB215182]|uniref:cobalamin B12-binding domain-containing protein n=1 Tax=Cognatiyoonia sp. IB215182 TaxID=3097353 RepID=UPI002A137131|nr:cobalamin-binding protein [Cognatiyoonia sp. IB215182]MDX8353303.1 cobalamin-binding protein [Cognatiyoonia sp. IB215182]
MARVPMDEGAFDRSEYDRADQQFRLAKQKLPREAVNDLAREVVRRLRFRMPRTMRKEDLPGVAEIDLLCSALLSPNEDAADQLIMAARRDGVDVDAIYLGYVAGAARRLGEMWDADEVSFIDVTLGCAKLYRIIRGLRHIVAPGIVFGRDEKPALFALVPGETHTLGIEMATDLFRREGWDVDMMVGLDHEVLVDQAEHRSYQAIVLVANSDGMMQPLIRLILALRITQPLAHIVVAGNILDHHPDIIHMVGADAVIKDIETAITKLRSVMDEPL